MAADSGEIVILGGGVAGLAASIYSGAPVYEADPVVGGVAGADTTDGFTFDRGIHILQTKNEIVLNLIAEMGVRLTSHERSAYIYSHGTYTPYPFQINTAGLPIGLRARCVWDFLRRDTNPEPTNYQEWMDRNLGRGFAEIFLTPYSEKFWGVHPREMTFEWTGNRVPRPSTAQVLRGALWSRPTAIGTNATFQYPERGAGYRVIAEAMAKRAARVHLSHRATRLDIDKRRITFAQGSEVDYELLISTIPLPELVRIASRVPLEVTEAVGKLRTNSIFVVNLGIGRPNLSPMHWAHYPERDISFFRISFPHNLGPDLAPPGTSSVSAEVAYSPANCIDRHTIVDRVREDLVRVRVLDRGDPIAAVATYDIPRAYCIYDKVRADAVATIHDWFKCVDIIPAGRYGFWTYFWSDEAILSGRKAALRARAKLGLESDVA